MPLSFDWPFPERPSIFYKTASTLTIGLVGSFSRFWMSEILLDAVLNRNPDRALITVANHHSCMDDPLLIAATMPLRIFWNRRRMRWSLGADDIVFTVRKHQLFFSLGKTIPVTRGDGVYQRPMDFALEQVNQGGWIHIFPEGVYFFI
ncbi:unnamed protein product [Rotaria sp. Silwood2]|nr:unnamed protein product [Rotaria sp. Silwood2]